VDRLSPKEVVARILEVVGADGASARPRPRTRSEAPPPAPTATA
jgi:hypothetical protein